MNKAKDITMWKPHTQKSETQRNASNYEAESSRPGWEVRLAF